MSCQLIGQTPTVAALLLRSVPSWDPFHWPKASIVPRLTRAFIYYCCALAWIVSEGFAWRKAQWAAVRTATEMMGWCNDLQRGALSRILRRLAASIFIADITSRTLPRLNVFVPGISPTDRHWARFRQLPVNCSTIAGSNSPIFLENYNEYCRPVIL